MQLLSLIVKVLKNQWYILILLSIFSLQTQANNKLHFDEFYASVGVMGMEFSDKIKSSAGKEVEIEGFMAPPLKAKANFFVLTSKPMALCPFCSSDADWPADIIVIYLKEIQTFVNYNKIIKVQGLLEYGSWTDEETGFVSQLRLVNAKFE